MKSRLSFGVLILIILFTIARLPAAELDITKIQAMPEGNYLCNLLMHGKEQMLNFEIKGNDLICVNAANKGIIGLRGKSQFIGNGVFMTQLQGGDFRATQFWVFNKDGTAAIKEMPDRGEKQKAIPVKGKTLDKPAVR